MRKGLNESEVEAAIGDLDTADLPEPTIAALRLVDTLTDAQPEVNADVYADLRRHFDDDQILELGTALSVGSGWQRFIEAFGIRPDLWNEATPLPWQGDRSHELSSVDSSSPSTT